MDRTVRSASAGHNLLMSRILAVTLFVLALTGAGLATAAQARAEDEGTTYQRYADIRERLYACQLETLWGTQTAPRQSDCHRLARDFVLYASPGEGYVFHVHCRSASRCIPTPSGEPAANGPYPAGANIYDIKVSRTSTRRKRSKARARRSLAAHGSATAAR